jgi:hypothetical protein
LSLVIKIQGCGDVLPKVAVDAHEQFLCVEFQHHQYYKASSFNLICARQIGRNNKTLKPASCVISVLFMLICFCQVVVLFALARQKPCPRRAQPTPSAKESSHHTTAECRWPTQRKNLTCKFTTSPPNSQASTKTKIMPQSCAPQN